MHSFFVSAALLNFSFVKLSSSSSPLTNDGYSKKEIRTRIGMGKTGFTMKRVLLTRKWNLRFRKKLDFVFD